MLFTQKTTGKIHTQTDEDGMTVSFRILPNHITQAITFLSHRSSMATQSTVTGKDIEQWLRKGEFVLVNKPNYSSEIWKDDLRLVGRLAEGKTIPLFGWCACAHCHKTFQTHGNLDKQGKVM